MHDCAGSLQVCRLRVTKLDADGAPLVGATTQYVTDTLISLAGDPQVVPGEDMTLKNGCGEPSVQFQDEDAISRLNLAMSLTKPDPELIGFLTGAPTFSDAGEVIGWGYPRLNTSVMGDAVSIEAFTKAIVNGRQATDRPWWGWAYPWTEWRLAANTLENAPLALALVGRALENENWGDGPDGDWVIDTDRAQNVQRFDDIPDAACGASAVAAS